MTNIVLIGFRGAGKTVIGRRLARRLKRRLIETDELIIRVAGMSVKEIVERYGWRGFRELESRVVEEVSRLDDCIVDTGGGVVLRRENIDNLKENGIVIWLKADAETVISRIRHDTERPSLTGNKSFVEEVEEVLNQRKKMYEDAADYSIDTSKLKADKVVTRIIGYLKRKKILE